ncbi:phage regulatory CII family protein [Sodalis sp. dw_96]|uniref:phage regulatory CII family protein n=1 Tax=Sodalis sp. dw_96 TaxID=2719794 RepID=UPI001BD3ACB0|nr:phage regulatory CII family protein [Sodalis sp. dw_96]
MFKKGTGKYPLWDAALQHFAQTNDTQRLAENCGLDLKSLSEKLDPGRLERLTAAELIHLTHESGDCTLLDGMLAQLGIITPNDISNSLEHIYLPDRAMRISAKAVMLPGRAMKFIVKNAHLNETSNTDVYLTCETGHGAMSYANALRQHCFKDSKTNFPSTRH